MELSEKTLSSSQVFDGRLLKVYLDQVGLANGDTAIREFVHHPGGAAVVALDGEGNVYLERQFRYPYHKVVTEIPAGKLEPGEDPFDAIRRELKEEIGAEAERWDALGHIMPPWDTPMRCSTCSWPAASPLGSATWTVMSFWSPSSCPLARRSPRRRTDASTTPRPWPPCSGRTG